MLLGAWLIWCSALTQVQGPLKGPVVFFECCSGVCQLLLHGTFCHRLLLPQVIRTERNGAKERVKIQTAESHEKKDLNNKTLYWTRREGWSAPINLCCWCDRSPCVEPSGSSSSRSPPTPLIVMFSNLVQRWQTGDWLIFLPLGRKSCSLWIS